VSNLKKEKPTKEKVDLKDRECNYCGTRGHTEAKSIVWVIYNHRKKSSTQSYENSYLTLTCPPQGM
jgi:hypothetical protein